MVLDDSDSESLRLRRGASPLVLTMIPSDCKHTFVSCSDLHVCLYLSTVGSNNDFTLFSARPPVVPVRGTSIRRNKCAAIVWHVFVSTLATLERFASGRCTSTCRDLDPLAGFLEVRRGFCALANSGGPAA